MTDSSPGHLRRFLLELPLAILSPLLVILAAVALAASDLWGRLRKTRTLSLDQVPDTGAASIVIPNWNGRDLLAKYLPSVVEAAERVPGSEVIVVDNGSDDGSADYVREHFPQVRVLALEHNLGFGGGSNAGFQAAKHEVVVLLNSDMRVEPDFLEPLLRGFTDAQVFSVSCQIFLSDPTKRREETGLTEGWWERGTVRVGHHIDAQIDQLYPCFYGGGGSCAYDRRKFFELGGFDELLAPFYLEDTDLGYLAWKRGWKNFYQPASVVYHEHRGTIGRKFSNAYIQGVLKKNFLLFTWKNIHEWRRLLEHFFFAWAGALLSWLAGDSPQRSSLTGIARATLQLPGVFRSRSRARALATVSDTDALRRHMGGYFRDTFPGMTPSDNEPPRVLFVAPYPICPPSHGGGVFMYHTVRELVQRTELHAIVLLDNALQRPPHDELDAMCASTEYIVRTTAAPRTPGAVTPHAVREFRRRDLRRLIHRQIYMRNINVVQLEYMHLGQYAEEFRRIPNFLFEHDVYFQSVERRLPFLKHAREKISARWEYLCALRYELRLLPKLDRIQVCSRDNREYLESFLPQLKGRIDDGFRAGIDTSRYEFSTESLVTTSREPLTMLFLGSSRHLPNKEALDWFTAQVLPLVLAEEPRARLVVVGSDASAQDIPLGPGVAEAIEFAGFVDDVRDALKRYAVFICPILSGSGVRVKLLEAFAAGIPVVSTRLGAEGLADRDGDVCALADQPEDFARHVVELLRDPQKASALAQRARAEVVAKRDIRGMTERLVECYREEIARKRQRADPRIEASSKSTLVARN